MKKEAGPRIKKILQFYRQRALFLRKSTRKIAQSDGWSATLKQVVESAVPQLAPHCFIRIQPEGTKCYEESAGMSQLHEPSARWNVPLYLGGINCGILSGSYHSDRHPFQLRLIREYAENAERLLEKAWCHKQLHFALNARDDFLISASHELRTPITTLRIQARSIRKMLSLSAAHDSFSESVKNLLDLMERQTLRLETLINSLLEATRAKSGILQLELKQTLLSEIIRNMIHRNELELKASGCKLDLSLDETIVGLWDPARLEQAFSNLLLNAIKYGRGSPIHITTTRKNSAAIISIRDEGIGISPEYHEKAFELFERSVSTINFSGFGTGLFVCRWIVNAHQGTIQIESQPEKGTLVRITLPMEVSLSSVPK